MKLVRWLNHFNKDYKATKMMYYLVINKD